MTSNNAERAFFVALLIAVTLAFVWLIRGFLQPIFWAIALGIVVYPLHARFARRLRGRSALAAAISIVTVVVVVIVPLIGIGVAVTREGAALYQRLDAGEIGVQNLYERATASMPRVVATLERFGIDTSGLESQLSSAAITASRFVASRALSIGQDTVRAALFFFLTLYLLFFFLRDGPRLLEGLVRALPFGDERERHLLERFAEVSRATIKGTLVVGVAQGAIGGIAFAILGIGAPVLWAVVMALLSVLPAVGPALVWLPTALVLILNGNVIAGVALVLIGVFVIGLVDNLLRPVLVGRDTQMPDYLILLSTLGGLAALGLAGIIIGPIIAAFFLSVWQMAEHEFKPSTAEAAPEPREE